MKIYVLGICGTFMGGLAQLASEKGMQVSGCDENVYPPMDQVLFSKGISIDEGYNPKNLPKDVDMVVVGNVIARGNPLMESILNKGIDFISGPEFLSKYLLSNRHVIAVSGTHGKTSVSSMITKVLLENKIDCGYLIAGRAKDLSSTASLGKHNYFVIEADEYDTAFFDKRSKFIHYHPKTLLINNLEFDHADIFDNLNDIKKQFHHLLRLMPSEATLIYPEHNINIQKVISMGFYSNKVPFNVKTQKGWHARKLSPDASKFEIYSDKKKRAQVDWTSIGEHSLQNGLATFVVCKSLGLKSKAISKALSKFNGVSRRMDLVGEKSGIKIYDDFAHHPTAIKFTLEGLRKKVGNARIICLLEMRSNTMLSGYHDKKIPRAIQDADEVYVFSKDNEQISALENKSKKIKACSTTQEFLMKLGSINLENTHLICLSNGSFDGIHQAILERI